jgi:hypothetical protein
VEARTGRIYSAKGLGAAFDWIELELMPMFEKQEANRTRNKRRSWSGFDDRD